MCFHLRLKNCQATSCKLFCVHVVNARQKVTVSHLGQVSVTFYKMILNTFRLIDSSDHNRI